MVNAPVNKSKANLFKLMSVAFIREFVLVTSITWRRVGVGAEQNAESSLVVDGLAGGILSARLDTVGEHERARLRVEHIGRRRIDVTGDELERDAVIRAAVEAGTGRCG